MDTKKYRYFIWTIPFSSFTLSPFTFLQFFPSPLWCKFQSHLRPFFPLFCTCLKKKKKYPFFSAVHSLSSSFLFRSSQFPLAPSPSSTLPHCFHGTVVGVSHRKWHWRDAYGTGEFRVNFYPNVTRTYTSLKKHGSDLGQSHLFDKVYVNVSPYITSKNTCAIYTASESVNLINWSGCNTIGESLVRMEG